MHPEAGRGMGQRAGRAEEESLPAPGRVRRILVAYDTSKGSRDALAWARWLARENDATVLPTMVLPPTPRTLGGGLTGVSSEAEGTIRAVLEDDERYAEGILEGVGRELDAFGVDARTVVTKGRPANELLRVIKQEIVDLVVVGPHKVEGLNRAVLGSVSNAVVQRAPTSVLVARNRPPVARTLLAVDGSRRSYEAAAFLHSLPEAARDAHVVHVLPSPFAGLSPKGREAMHDTESRIRADVEKQVRKTDGYLNFELLFGKPAEKILEAANEDDTDLIVLGAHGTGRMPGMALGSVAHQVANRADASVLLARGV